jgi:hypothetical protein
MLDEIYRGDFDADLETIDQAVRNRRAQLRRNLPQYQIDPAARIRPLYLIGAVGHYDAATGLWYAVDDLHRGWKIGNARLIAVAPQVAV